MDGRAAAHTRRERHGRSGLRLATKVLHVAVAVIGFIQVVYNLHRRGANTGIDTVVGNVTLGCRRYLHSLQRGHTKHETAISRPG